MSATLRIALAAARNLPSVEERLRAAIVCFPETYIPGLRGQGFEVPPPDQRRQEQGLERIRAKAGRCGVAVVLGMEWETGAGLHNAAFVISPGGIVAGYQAKNQIPPEEEPFYVADGRRRLFEVEGVPFGITICHEGWRYPESVRWAAARGARLVFHPQLTGSDLAGPRLGRWGDPGSPYYEKAMIARSVENVIYFASVNYAMRFQQSATSLLAPDGRCLAHVPYGEEQLLVCDVDPAQATGLYARRYNPALYPPK